MRRLLIIGALIILAASAMGADPEPDTSSSEYKKFERKSNDINLMSLSVDREMWHFSLYLPDAETIYSIPADEVKQKKDKIQVGDDITLDASGMYFPDAEIRSDDIDEIRINIGPDDESAVLNFIQKKDKRTPRARRKMDRLSLWEAATITTDDFVRGSVVSFYGDIAIDGEVNRDVVAIFGDIKIGGDAVVRGDIIAINGTVKLDPESSVYGEIITGEGHKSSRRDRARRWKDRVVDEFSIDGHGAYNRIDGLFLMAGLNYNSSDSIVPSFYVHGGYAFASERWRYDVGLTQILIKGSVPVQVGGSFYRLLKSDDDKFISENENSLFALLVNEDWKDYYEAEGAYGFVRVGFMKFNSFEIGYRSEDQNWLPAHRNLWSLFGSRLFRENFAWLPADEREDIIAADFDDKQVNSLNLKLQIDTRDDDDNPGSGWYGQARYEYAPEDFNGDFDFKRAEVLMKRYQPINRYNSLILRGAYGRVSGNSIPANKFFTLGGLSTLHGYKHKEFAGNEYFMLGAEYRYRIPRTDISPFLLYEVGKIGQEELNENDEWLHALGVGVAFNHNFKIFLAQRLDRDEKKPAVYIRFGFSPF